MSGTETMTIKKLKDFLQLLSDGGVADDSPVYIQNENGHIDAPAGFTVENNNFILEVKSNYDPHWHGSHLMPSNEVNNKGIRSPYRTSPDGGTSI